MTGTLAVVGAGLMGSGIAQVAAVAGWQVALRDVDEAALGRGKASVEKSLARFVERGTLSAPEQAAALDRIATTTDLVGAAADADLVIEAVFESLPVKLEVFAQLDDVCKDGAVLATNTSAIPVTTIAAATRRPESVVGTHFFSPVPMMRLCELVRGHRTSDESLAVARHFAESVVGTHFFSPVPMMRLCELVRGHRTSDESLAVARHFAESVGKTCIVVNRDVAGFVTTRLICALAMEAVALYESGVASAEDIDTACRLGFGHTMGPLATVDLTGVDVLRNASMNIYADTADAKFFPPELLSRMVDAGDLGRKSGSGFFAYDG